MDLVTLVTACALGVEPKLMHALVWQQSGGEPWAVSVPNEPMPRVYSSMQQAISETRTASIATGAVRVGLAGLPVVPSKVNPAIFLPCRNVAIAAQRIAKLSDRCKAHPRLKGDPTFCAVATYRGSWERPDVKFAEAVTATAARCDAPNFDMPKDTSIEFLDIGSDTTPPPDEPTSGPDTASNEQQRGWSSALPMINRLHKKCRRPASPMHIRSRLAHPSIACSCCDHPIGDRNDRPWYQSREFAAHRTNGGGEEWRRTTAERWQDKSRGVRGGRSAGKTAMIKDLAQCAQAHDSLPIRTSHCKHKQQRTSRSKTNDTRR